MTSTLKYYPSLTSLFLLLQFGYCCPAYSQMTRVVTMTGDLTPDGNGIISFTDGNPALNNLGQAVFTAGLSSTADSPDDDEGIFVGTGDGVLSQVARKGTLVPGGNGTFDNLGRPAINDVGQILFGASLNNTTGGSSDNLAIYRGDGFGLVPIVQRGQAAPDGNGVFDTMTGSINNSGDVVLEAMFSGVAGRGIDQGIFRSSAGTIARLARTGQAAPNGDGEFLRFNTPIMNSTGTTSFTAVLVNVSGEPDASVAIFLTSGGSLVEVARTGQVAPNGNGIYDFINDPAMNEEGTIVFRAQFANSAGDSISNSGIYTSSGGTPVAIASQGQLSPDGDGLLSFFASNPKINSAGQVAVLSTLSGTSTGNLEWILLRHDAGVGLKPIARGGDLVPDGNGVFRSFNGVVLNEMGQIAFKSVLSNTNGGSSDDFGLFLYDDILGMQTIAREGNPFLGSTIRDLSFESNLNANGPDQNGFNDRGELAYRFILADGRVGVAVYSPIPEPVTWMILATGFSVMLLKRHRLAADW